MWYLGITRRLYLSVSMVIPISLGLSTTVHKVLSTPSCLLQAHSTIIIVVYTSLPPAKRFELRITLLQSQYQHLKVPRIPPPAPFHRLKDIELHHQKRPSVGTYAHVATKRSEPMANSSKCAAIYRSQEAF